MAKRDREPIRTVSYVTRGEDNKSVVFAADDPAAFPAYPFTPEQREEIGTQLALTYFNELFRGRAVFYRREDAPPSARR